MQKLPLLSELHKEHYARYPHETIKPLELLAKFDEPIVDRYSGAAVAYKTGEGWDTEVGNKRDGDADTNVFLVGNWRGITEDQYKDVLGSYIIAYRDGRPVGRITAQVDHRLNEYQGVKWGLFGFFESENDPAVASSTCHRVRATAAGACG